MPARAEPEVWCHRVALRAVAVLRAAAGLQAQAALQPVVALQPVAVLRAGGGGPAGGGATGSGGATGAGGASGSGGASGYYYVSPTGTGTACSQSAPCSITQGQANVQAAVKATQGDITVELADGVYALTVPLVFTAADSPPAAAGSGAPATDGGVNGPTVVWQAAAGAHPVLSGAQKVTGWTVSDSAKNIYKASAPNSFATRQLYVDGKIAVRARTTVSRSCVSFNSTGIGGVPSSVTGASQPGRIEFHAIGSWTDRYAPVEVFSGSTATMVQPAWANNLWGFDTISNSYRPSSTWFENAYEFLDSPGEWYLDTAAGALYYIPLPGQDMSNADVELPQLEYLLAVGGTLDAPAHDIVFQGLTFSYTSWLNPNTSDGWADQQTGGYIHGDGKNEGYPNGYPDFDSTRPVWWQMPGGVQVSAAKNVTFLRDRFVGLGSVALGIGNDDNAHKSGVGLGADTINVTGCVFTQIAASGILVGGLQANAHHPSDQRMIDQNITISNNLIHDIGIDYRDADAILLTYVASSLVSHNEVYDLPYSAISNGYGWGQNDDGGSEDYQARGLYQYQPLYTTPTTSKNNQFVANYIHDNQQQMNDGGAFYELSASPGTVFSQNYVKAPAQSAGTNFGTYSDEGTRYLTFSQNVFDGWGAWANLNCTDVNETGNITYTGNWGATAEISGQSGCSSSSRSCPASYVNSGPTYAGNPTNVSVPSLASTWTAGNCGDVVANSTDPTSAAAAQAVANAAGLEAAYADIKNTP
ncbi:MAG: right-handed parallel beta-helix repeat-containing protein [Polyangia bacterium]